MDHFQDASPEMALAVLTDSAAVSEIEQAVKSEDEDSVAEAVTGAYGTKARELQEAVAASERRMAEMSRSLAEAEARVAEIEVQRSRAREAASAADHERSAAEEARRQHMQDRDRWNAERQALEQKVAEAAGRPRHRRGQGCRGRAPC